MRKAILGKLGIGGIAALAIAAACSSSTAAGNVAPGSDMSADGGTGMSADGGAMGGMAHDMGTAAGSAAHDMGQGAQAAGQDMKQGAQAAGQTMADAGTQAMGAARDTASGAATTASDAAKGATGMGADAGSMAGAGSTATTGDADKGAKGETKAAATVTEPQIAAIAVAANDADIAAAKVAVKQTKNAKVKEFANLMIKDHSANNKACKALAKKLKITPEQSDTSKQLKQGGDENIASLKKLKGAEFDKAYVDHEVAYHQQVLSAIDDTLLPNAKNEELKSLLTKTRGTVNDHYEHAKSLQGSLGGESK